MITTVLDLLKICTIRFIVAPPIVPLLTASMIDILNQIMDTRIMKKPHFSYKMNDSTNKPVVEKDYLTRALLQ